MSEDPILSALARIETNIKGVETEQTRLRVDLMARMDRLQTRLDGLDEHLTLGLGTLRSRRTPSTWDCGRKPHTR